MEKPLLNEFPPVSTTEWEEKIRIDLKGADYNSKLVWKTGEGFDMKPYYREEDLSELKVAGRDTDLISPSRIANAWIIREDIFPEEISVANKLAITAMNSGAGALGLRANSINTHKEINELLAGIDISEVMINFISSRSYPLTLELFHYEISHRELDHNRVRGSLNFDPISYLLLHGDFYSLMESNFEEAAYIINTLKKRLPLFKGITVNGQHFSNAGSSLVQELAFTLASANEYLFQLTSRGFTIDEVAKRMMFSFSIGSNYFMEIAKLRAARLLWSKMVEQYNPVEKESHEIFIHSVTSNWNKTLYEPYSNMLRTTTEGMSAITGMADSLTILPFSNLLKEVDPFALRIARNQQMIMKEEAYLGKVADPSKGSYYIENLTESIAIHAWNLFKDIEEEGGMINSIKAGTIQKLVEESNQKKIEELATRKRVLIGTNQYPQPMETLKEEAIVNSKRTLDYEKALYPPLVLTRGAKNFEEIRRATEAHVEKGFPLPGIFLFPIGNPVLSKARAAFATGFYGCAGFRIIQNHGFNTIEEGIISLSFSSANVVVICSSDDEYPVFAPSIISAIRSLYPTMIVIVAGFPKESVELLKQAGVDDFIHIRSNITESLGKLQKQLGII
ncbi:MAG: methylmalonyl-CoA mutase family protein [Bacteroidota bacterium]